MTMKKIVLSALAATMVTSVALAGTISPKASGDKIGSELLSVRDVNVSNVMANATYTPSDIPASAVKNPIFQFEFTNLKDLDVNTTAISLASVYEVLDGNESNVTNGNRILVANNAQVSGSTKNVISFTAATAGTYAYNNKMYQVCDTNTTNGTSLAGVVVKDSTGSVTLQAKLYSGDSNKQVDASTAKTIFEIADEFSASVTQKFDATIDAASSFFKFKTNATDTTALDDDNVTITVKDGNFTHGLGTAVVWNLFKADQNLSVNTTTVSALAGSTIGDTTPDNTDFNVSINSTNAELPILTNLTVDGNSKIEKTKFVVHTYITDAELGTTKVDLITYATIDDKNAGEWKIYGYTAQIPDAVVKTGAKETYINVTNRSSLSANAFFSIYPDTINADGSASNAGVDACEVDGGTIAANQTRKFELSRLTANCPVKTGTFAVELAVPTTPDSVYANAVQKNITLSQFKDLPVYNSSSMGY